VSRPLQVLLIEDSLADLMLMREALERHVGDFAASTIGDAEEAILYVGKLCASPEMPCPDVVLLDLNLPKGDGMDFLRALRDSRKCPRTAVIVVTSSDSPRDRARAAEMGAARYFRKPSDLDEFLTLGGVVKEVLSERGYKI
jgi:DNA-binding response OmpR family regulator